MIENINNSHLSYINYYDKLPVILSAKEIIEIITMHNIKYYNVKICHSSDHHFNENNIFNYRKNIFICKGEMNITMQDNLIKCTNNNDIIFLHGDIFDAEYIGTTFASYKNHNEDSNRLIIIILGNHDRPIKGKVDPLEKILDIIYYYNLNIHILNDYVLQLTNNIYLSHEPLSLEFLKNNNAINIHGHIHPGPNHGPIYNTMDNNEELDIKYHYNCTVDCNDYKPIYTNYIINLINSYNKIS